MVKLTANAGRPYSYWVLLIKCLDFEAIWAVSIESTGTIDVIKCILMVDAYACMGLTKDNKGAIFNPEMVKEIEGKGRTAKKRVARIIEFHNVPVVSQHRNYCETSLKIVK